MTRENKSYAIHQGSDDIILKIVCYVLVGLFALLCLFPFVLMITSSFMTEKEIVAEGYKLFPKKNDYFSIRIFAKQSREAD